MSDRKKGIFRPPRPSSRHKWVWTETRSEWDGDRYVTVGGKGYWYDGPWTLAHDVAAVFVAEDFQWFEDDASIPNATALAAQNTSVSVELGKQLRLRVNVGETNTAAGTGLTTGGWTLQFAVNGGAWTTVGAATNVRYFNSSFLTNTTLIATGNHVLTWSGSEAASSQGDECEDGVSVSHSGSGWSNEHTEIEYAVDLNTGLSIGDSITFRVLDPNGAALAFTNVPTVAIAAVVNPTVGSMAFATSTPTPKLSVPSASLAISGQTPQRAYGLQLVGYQPTVVEEAGNDNHTIEVPTGSLNLVTTTPSAR